MFSCFHVKSGAMLISFCFHVKFKFSCKCATYTTLRGCIRWNIDPVFGPNHGINTSK